MSCKRIKPYIEEKVTKHGLFLENELFPRTIQSNFYLLYDGGIIHGNACNGNEGADIVRFLTLINNICEPLRTGFDFFIVHLKVEIFRKLVNQRVKYYHRA
eukprot:228163_1